jgi:hypothetical protein
MCIRDRVKAQWGELMKALDTVRLVGTGV